MAETEPTPLTAMNDEFRRVLRQEVGTDEKYPLAHWLAVRGAIDLGIAAIGSNRINTLLEMEFKGDEPKKTTRESLKMWVYPGKDGSVIFNVSVPDGPNFDGANMEVVFTPESFCVSSAEERLRFDAYRAFINLCRQLPGLDEEAGYAVGPFQIQVHPEDYGIEKWQRVWARWENAHAL